MSLDLELLKQLEAAPEDELLGVVSAGGVSGVGSRSSGKEMQWFLLITLTGWKPSGGALRDSSLVIRKPVSEPEILAFRAKMDPYDVVRVRARWLEENVFGSPQALLTGFLGRDATDPELNAHARALQEPVTFVDRQFGEFTLDRQLDWYAAAPEWRGQTIRLSMDAGSPEHMERALATARQLWAAQDEWVRKIAAHAVAELLALKNGAWLGEEEEEFSAEAFVRRMELESISVTADGAFEFWHNDGDLFWGHSIVVRGNLTEGPTDAGIEG